MELHLNKEDILSWIQNTDDEASLQAIRDKISEVEASRKPSRSSRKSILIPYGDWKNRPATNYDSSFAEKAKCRQGSEEIERLVEKMDIQEPLQDLLDMLED